MTGQRLVNFIFEVIGLQTPRGRIVFIVMVIIIGAVINHETLKTLPNFSLYSRLGIPSPSIGMTRAFLHVMDGDIRAAYHQNYLIFPVLLLVGYILTSDILRLAKQKN